MKDCYKTRLKRIMQTITEQLNITPTMVIIPPDMGKGDLEEAAVYENGEYTYYPLRDLPERYKSNLKRCTHYVR